MLHSHLPGSQSVPNYVRRIGMTPALPLGTPGSLWRSWGIPPCPSWLRSQISFTQTCYARWAGSIRLEEWFGSDPYPVKININHAFLRKTIEKMSSLYNFRFLPNSTLKFVKILLLTVTKNIFPYPLPTVGSGWGKP